MLKIAKKSSGKTVTLAQARINVEKAEPLIAVGRMREPGLAAIEAAKADGRFGPPRVEGRSV